MESFVADFLLPAGMLALMFGMGLTLRTDDFRRIASAPTATALGTVLQLIGMPLVGIAIALWFELPPLLGAGLIVAAACPGGMFSNVYVHLARANTALSVTLTATATLVTLFTLPLWVGAGVARLGGAGAELEMPVLDTALQLGMLTILPLALGMATRALRPQLAAAEKWLTRFGVVVITAGVAYDATQRGELPVAEFQASLPPALSLAAAGLVMGILGPALLRLPSRDAATITVELVVKNTLLGIVLARHSLGFDATIPILAFGAFQTPVGALVLITWRVLARHGLLREVVPTEGA
jgi:BASS family bile acid:Na+ symporter